MNNVPEMLDFVKAMSDPDRLKIIGLLTQHPATLSQVTEGLGLPTREAFNHLAFLKFVNVIRENDGLYELTTDGLEALARVQLDDTQQSGPASHQDAELSKYLRSDGSIRQIPNSRTQAERFHKVLEYLQAAFEPGVTYTEKEVNAVIRRFHEDVSGLRRDLIEAGLLARERDGSRYWRSG